MSPSSPVSADERPTLLFVDDEERILRSLRLLFAARYRVLVTTDGREALEILKREKVHALISDQRMPLMPGVDVLRQAREISPNTMRLLLTGYADREAVIGSINEGEVFRYLNKPWNADELRTTIAEAAGIAVELERLQHPDETPAESPSGLLLIDEAQDVAQAVSQLVREHFADRFTLHWARSREAALNCLESQRIALVISEIHIGGEDLTPFLKTLKRLHPQVVTLVLTSFDDTTLLVDLINQGQVHRFLPKPVRRAMTLRGLQSGLERSRELVRRPELTRRHKVETPKTKVDPGLVGRLRGLFGRLGAARN